MFRLSVLLLVEGGSGGALGIGVGDQILMLEHAVYTVATPEACAAILWKDAKKSDKAALALKITSSDLKDLGIIDEIVAEPSGGAHSNPLGAAAMLKQELIENLDLLSQISSQQRRDRRYEKFRRMGGYLEEN